MIGGIFIGLIPFLKIGVECGKSDMRYQAIENHAGEFAITNKTEMVWIWTGKK